MILLILLYQSSVLFLRQYSNLRSYFADVSSITPVFDGGKVKQLSIALIKRGITTPMKNNNLIFSYLSTTKVKV